MSEKVLIVEDQFVEANSLQIMLERAGYAVCSIARSVPVALKIIEKEQPDLVLVDIYLQGTLTGIDLAKELSKKGMAFVFISANSNKQILEAAKSTRPYGFIVKPFREKDVIVMLDVAWYLHQHNRSSRLLEQGGHPGKTIITAMSTNLNHIIGSSRRMLELVNNIRIVGPSDTSVLILGESGTGKELVAQGIHRVSSRKNKPFVVVNCGALPASLIESELFGHEKGAFTGASYRRIGKFEQAHDGTIFLDEIGELSLDLQVRFLRVLQEREIERIGGHPKKINVRIIAATNKDLEGEMAAGRFRIDLYYRLNIFPLILPPLRERKEDILLLANHFLNLFTKKQGKSISGFSQQAVKAMENYSWPGNVRELENVIERGVLLTNESLINTINLPADLVVTTERSYSGKVKTIEENERDHILYVLERCGWKVFGRGGAAEMLAINISTLNSRMKKLGITRDKAN